VKPLQELDDRVHVVPEDAFWWTTYSKIEEDGLLDDVTTHDWNEGASVASYLKQRDKTHLLDVLKSIRISTSSHRSPTTSTANNSSPSYVAPSQTENGSSNTVVSRST
jgi:hypothetical protein